MIRAVDNLKWLWSAGATAWIAHTDTHAMAIARCIIDAVAVVIIAVVIAVVIIVVIHIKAIRGGCGWLITIRIVVGIDVAMVRWLCGGLIGDGIGAFWWDANF